MSKKTLRLEDGRLVRHPDRIDSAIWTVTGYDYTVCSGVCFPVVYRAWMSHFAFQVA